MLSPHVLSARLADLLAREHHAMADFLVALADFDQKRAWVELGHNSLFSYLRRDLHLSAGAAQYRKTAAELVQRFPEVLVALRAGDLCLTSVVQLAKVITAENLPELLPRFFGLSGREAEALAVSIRPVEDPPRREVVTAVRAPAAPAAAPDLLFRAPEMEDRVAPPASPQPPAAAVAPPSRTRQVEPLDATHARFHLTVSKQFLDKLQATKDALSHSRPGASSEEALEACMDLMLKEHAKRRGIVDRPRKATPNPTPNSTPTLNSNSNSNPTRYVPAEISRAVWLRDQGKCQWPVASGGVCGSTVRAEIHHQDAWAKHHGPPTVDRLMILCGVHNDLAARQDYGAAWMDRFRGRSRGRGQRGGAPEQVRPR